MSRFACFFILNLAILSLGAQAEPKVDLKGNANPRIYDVMSVKCEFGAPPEIKSVFVPGAVLQMKDDVVEAFAKENSDRTSVILRYPIAKEGLDDSAHPPCQPGDTLLVEMKRR